MSFFSNGADREKLAVLYILKLAAIPLSREQIAGVLFEHGYENFITLTELLTELEENAAIATIPAYHLQTVVLTRRGDEIVSLFENNLPKSMRDKLNAQIEANAESFRRENSSQMESRANPDGSFSTRLALVENGEPFFEVHIKLPTAKYTRIAERRWEEINKKLYYDTLIALAGEPSDAPPADNTAAKEELPDI